MRLLILRHGKTQGNIERRYVGRTDEALCEVGIDELKELAKHTTLRALCKRSRCIYVSPLIRCIQTAEIVFPNKAMNIVEQLKEMDFGDFEGKNYKELSSCVQYQEWIDSNGTLPFPNGEGRQGFQDRCCKGFLQICQEEFSKKDLTYDTIILVVHGGTIMSILERYEKSGLSFFDYQVANGCGYVCSLDYDHVSSKAIISIEDRVESAVNLH